MLISLYAFAYNSPFGNLLIYENVNGARWMHCPCGDGSIFFTAKNPYPDYMFSLLMHCIKSSGQHLPAAVQLFFSFSVNFYFIRVGYYEAIRCCSLFTFNAIINSITWTDNVLQTVTEKRKPESVQRIFKSEFIRGIFGLCVYKSKITFSLGFIVNAEKHEKINWSRLFNEYYLCYCIFALIFLPYSVCSFENPSITWHPILHPIRQYQKEQKHQRSRKNMEILRWKKLCGTHIVFDDYIIW